MIQFLLSFLLFANVAFGATAYRIPAAPVITKATTGSRPSGEEGQWYSNSTLHLPQYHDNSSWYSFLLAGQASIVNADINASAAIAYSKLNLTGAILNADINASAAIAYSKLNLATSIVNADVSASAAIAYSKLNLANSVVLTSDVTGTLPATKGGTGVATYTLGDILYSSAANTLSKLAGNTTTELRVLTQTGDGVNSAAPNWTTQATSTAVASTIVVRDSSQGFTAGKISAVFAPNTTVIATAAGTTTLTSTSSQQEIFTGSTTQTVVLPVVTTLQNGYYYRIVNLSTGQVTVQTSGANSLQVMGPSSELIATVLDSTAGTGTASWTAKYSGLANSGGGGGGSLIWIEDADGLSPIRDTSSNFAIRLFEAGRTQYMYTSIRVPTSYTAGNQINLKVPYSSPDTSGTVQETCLATLIRTGTDAVTSTTNQRTSTNGTDNLATGALANKAKTQTCDITTSTGTINSVAVSAGDIILVRLTRGTDTATSNIKTYVELSEVTFQ